MPEIKRQFFDICEECKQCEYLKESPSVSCSGCMENGFKNWVVAMKQKPAIWDIQNKTVTIQLSDCDWEKAKKMNFGGIWSFGFRAR